VKNTSYISWDEYFMGVALLASKRSKDPNTQVGACIVSGDTNIHIKENTILSIGYNGLPYGCSDDEFPWDRQGELLETKYPYVVHAELNAILNAQGKSLMGTKIYVALFPCNECAKAIIQSGIKEVIYLSDKYSETDIVKASKKMFESAGVKLTKLNCNSKKIELSFNIEDI
jgi:dCMP deaminase